MDKLIKNLNETREFIFSQSDIRPKLGIVFGSGIKSEQILDITEARIEYGEIPHFASSTVPEHKGELIIGKRKGKGVYIFSGRFHYYEGYSARKITYPIRFLQFINTPKLILTNAAGGVNPEFFAGDIILIKDHINLIPDHPLRGKNPDHFGTRFPDMSDAYCAEMRKQIKAVANFINYKLKEGVYLALQGPSLETPAEYSMIYRMGGDLIGMSTVFETIAAVHGGMKVAGFSVVSNECYPPERIVKTTHEDVVEVVSKSEKQLMAILEKWIDNYL